MSRFTAQHLQLVHAATRPEILSVSTLEARVRETQAEVRRVFLALVGGG